MENRVPLLNEKASQNANGISYLTEYYASLVSLRNFFIVAALGTSVAALILSRNWVTDGGAFYLGTVDWNTNLFAYHVVFMAGFFFFCQVWAISIMNFLKGTQWATPIHIICHLGALGTLISGLYAIIKNKDDSNRVHLASLHSWIGVLATSFYMLNFLAGSVGKTNAETLGVTLKHPTAVSLIGNCTLYRLAHVILGISSIISAAMAIITGIMKVQAGAGGCTFNLSSTELNEYANDPAYLFQYLAVGCKVQNGIALTVIFATLCVCISTLLSLISEQMHSLTIHVPKSVGRIQL